MSDVSEDSRAQQRNRIETSSTTVIGNPQTDRAASITEKSPYFLPLHFILICHNGERGCCPNIHLAEGRTLLTSSFQDEARTVRKKSSWSNLMPSAFLNAQANSTRSSFVISLIFRSVTVDTYSDPNCNQFAFSSY